MDRLARLKTQLTQMALEDTGRLEYYKQQAGFNQHPGRDRRLRRKIANLEGQIKAYNNVLHMLSGKDEQGDC